MGDVILPALQFLDIKEYSSERGSSNTPGLLAVIFAPALNTLVYNRQSDIAAFPETLLAFLKRVLNLTQLTLGNCSTDTLLECIQHCPHLAHLDLGKLSYPRRVATRELDDQLLLGLFLDNDCLCPRLDHFRTSTIFTPSLETIRSIIHRKNGAVLHLAQWKALRLFICYDSRDGEEIERLRAEVTANARWKQVDICFNRVFQVACDIVHDLAHHVQLRNSRDPCLPGDDRIFRPRDTAPRDTWPSSDAWPLGECP